ncbi:MAG TPA: MBL fold metallo-hydrolase [Rhizomicrobium sp.]|jgi:phosphoribosyl 1,2-cyclic phosphate phosphodiesterase|nr:MBL fold metallo-hydrolase [Rhizomicrobium sp.]
MSDTLDVTILGCGSSSGVPRVGGPDGAGDWGACDPANPKNRRRRCSILARRKSAGGETAVLVDTAPDLREQLLSARCGRIDAALITHDHADQTHGLDDLRAVAYGMRRRVDLYGDRATLEGLRHKFGYCFETPPGSGYPPILTAREIPEPFADSAVDGAGGAIPLRAFPQTHGSIRSLGFRLGPVAYSSDVNFLSEEAFAVLEGVDCWIVDALRPAPHPTHANVATALEWIARVKPRRAVLTNMHIDLDYETLRRELPPGVEPAYDGMVISLSV